VAGFFRDCARIGRERDAAASLAGLAAFQAVVTAGSGALVAHTLAGGPHGQGILQALLLVMLGAALGCGTASLQGHPYRSLGGVPLGATGLLVALAWAGLTATPGRDLPLLPCLLLGFAGGLVNVPLRAAYLAGVPADARGNGMAVMNTAIYVLTTVLALVVTGLVWGGLLATPLSQLAFLGTLAVAGAALAWWLLLTPTLEQFTEWVLNAMYRIRAHGPGRDHVPLRGPLLVVANHASWFDPFWLARVMPRHLTPMMTSIFFDLPVIRWLMVHVVRAIRVPATTFRREAPELADAVAVLRQGGCVLIFPEAMLRRKEEHLIRSFGQGVWRILQELPQTPVVVCWIEGGWGSFASYCNGPPLRNKRPDWRRQIDIAVALPGTLAPEVLADHRATRHHLQRACLECRRYLGLEVPAGGGKKEGWEGPAEKGGLAGPDPHQINP
jgi:1-acyl-sn-glycerol-3-phosphate acyltransferase